MDSSSEASTTPGGGGKIPINNQTIIAEHGSVISGVTQIIKNIFPRHDVDMQRNREDLLKNVNRIWIDGYLKESLAGMSLIELGLEDRPSAVVRPQDALLPAASRSPRLLQAGTTIHQVFKQSNGALLILGEPGSGKTTAMLTLASALLDEASRDHDLDEPQARIPLVAHLSLWQPRFTDLQGWLIFELNTHYSLPRKLAQTWLESGQFILLLDGLNEVSAENQEGCLHAINAFWQKNGLTTPMVVCCRAEEYRLLPEKLKFGAAVYLRKPSYEQVLKSLAEGGPDQQSITGLLEEDPILRELSRTPLMLRMMVSVYPGTPPPENPAGTIAARRKQLLDQYVDARLDQGIQPPGSRRDEEQQARQKQRMVSLLRWLAGEMSSHGLSVFYIESIQADWLPSRLLGLIYSGLVRLFIGTLIGLSAGLAFLVIQSTYDPWRVGLYTGLGVVAASLLALNLKRVPAILVASTLIAGIVYLDQRLPLCLVIAFLVALQCSLAGSSIEHFTIAETRVWSWRKSVPVLLAGLVVIVATLIFFLINTQSSQSPTDFFIRNIPYLLDFGLGILLAILLVRSWETSRKVDAFTAPNQGFWRAAHNAAKVILVSALFALANIFLAAIIEIGLGVTIFPLKPETTVLLLIVPAMFLVTGIPVSLSVGGAACIRHLTLRAILAATTPAPWKITRILDEAAGRLFLQKAGGGYLFLHQLVQEYFLENAQNEKGDFSHD